jgi:TonB family protein
MKKGETIMKTLTTPAVYGYQELRLLHQRYMMLAMLIAISIQMTIIGGYHLSEWLKPNDPPERIIHIGGEIYLPPPPITERLQNVGIPIVPTQFSTGIPIPVSDFEIKAENEFAGQDDLSRLADKQWETLGDGSVQIDVPGGKNVESDPLPNEPTLFEQEPKVVITTMPEYPEIARRIGLEGNVTIKALLDKEGKVKKVLLMKASDEIFTQATLTAAKKWVFTPALMNGKPVLVWIAIPFRFRLIK